MSASENKERVRRAYEDLNAANSGTLFALLAPDVVYTVIGTTMFSRTMRGREALVEQLVTPLFAALATPIVLDILNLVAEGDHVAMQARGHATAHSGAPYNNTYCIMFRFRGDQVAEVTEYLDTALVMRAFGVPSERAALLRSMDLNMWEMFREIVRLGRDSELIETPQFSMAFNPNGTPFHNMVMVKDVVDVDVVFAAVRDFYVRRGRVFSIWTRAHADAEFEAQLTARGFSQFITMPGMALLGDPGTRCEPPGLAIQAVNTDQGRRDYLHITAAAYATYGAPHAYAEDAFIVQESVCAPHIQGFVGYVNGQPVAAAAVYVTHGVAGIGWVGTVPEQRGHGYAEAVTWAAIREGFHRGGTFANLQASPMGRPIYERMGFITPTEYRVLVGTV